MRLLFLTLPVVLTSFGCANLHRSATSGYGSSNDEIQYSDQSQRAQMRDTDTRKTAYELGKDPNALNESDMAEIRERKRLRELERTLISKKEKEQYSKVLPWFSGDQEKIEFLSIPSIEGRQQWMNRKNIWARTQAPKQEMKQMVEAQDIAVGMPQEYVKKSWGDPLAVEVSGNPIYRNERWKYQRYTSTPEGFRKETRLVYFEGGRVVGWETTE
jgi:hypothetical protein